MKGIFMIALLVLSVVLQTNAQTPVDSTVVVQDTVAKVDVKTNHRIFNPLRKNKKGGKIKKEKRGGTTTQLANTSNDTVVPSQDSSIAKGKDQDEESKKKGQGFLQKLFGKSDSTQTDGCKDCENQLATANDENKNLGKQVEDLNTMLEIVKTSVENIDDRDFYRSLITAPLAKKYDSIQVDDYKKCADFFDHKTKKEMKWVYDVYYPLLDNYGKFTQDVAELIKGVIMSFENLAKAGCKPDIVIEKDLFENNLNETDYFKNYRYMGVSSKTMDNPSRRIDYLEEVINETKSLFEEPSKFTKENFEEQLRRLEKENE